MIPVTIDFDQLLENSYRDFHAKGLDYLCLERKPSRTTKVYFFEGDIRDAPEVVVPHDHRYSFDTDVLCGALANHTWAEATETTPGAEPFERFAYLTPLLGGNGFTWRESTWLTTLGRKLYRAGNGYWSHHAEIHTIQVCDPETIIVLRQYDDQVAVGVPTSAFKPAGQREAPSLDGLYSRMDADYALKRLRLLFSKIGRDEIRLAA